MRNVLKCATCALAMVAGLSAAEAQSRYGIGEGPYVFSRESVSKQPRHGYSGFYRGPQQLFCDYERRPIRTCNARGKCRVTRWVLKEYCY